MSQDLETSAPPPPTPWISTQHEMESSARPGRTRFVRIRLRSGVQRIASVTYYYAVTGNAADATREHLYRVSLQWLAELDPRDGKAAKITGLASANRFLNTLQFRVLESTSPEGQRSVFARLGPRGQIVAEPQNVGLMGFLRAILVEWVAAAHPDATLIPGSFAQADAPTADEQSLRNAFFTKSGFTVLPTPEGGGSYQAASIRSLKTTWNTDKVVEMTPAMIAEAFGAQLEALVLRKRVAALEAEVRQASNERRAAEVLSRIWLAISLVSFVFGIVMAIQPHLHL